MSSSYNDRKGENGFEEQGNLPCISHTKTQVKAKVTWEGALKIKINIK